MPRASRPASALHFPFAFPFALRPSFALVLLATLGLGCSPTVTAADFGVYPAGCRAPSACYRSDCACTRQTLSECLACDPRSAEGATCDCAQFEGTECLTPGRLCAGQGGAVCPGVGARCLPAGSGCEAAGGSPPVLVAASDADGGPSAEPRCAFSDDVCCPGTLAEGADLSASVVDAGSPD